MNDAYAAWEAAWQERMAKARATRAAKPKHRHAPAPERQPRTSAVREKDLNSIREWAAQGQTANYMAKILRKSSDTIRKICRENGIELRVFGVKRTFDHDEAVRRYNAGERVSYIAHVMGVPYDAVDSALTRAGVHRRQARDGQFRSKPLDPPAGEQFSNNEGWSQ